MTDDIEAFKFNTAVAALMEFTNTLRAHREEHGPSPAFQEATRTMLLLAGALCPSHRRGTVGCLGEAYSVHQQPWPTYDPALTAEETITLVVQVNGKVRDRITVPAGIGDDDARKLALESERVQRYLNGAQPKKTIIVPGRLVNIVA